MSATRRFLATAALLAPLALVSCAGDGDPSTATPADDGDEPEAIVQEKERGPVEVELRVEPKQPTYAERIRFTITVRAEEGVEATLPSPGENLGHFIVRDYVQQPWKATPEGKRESRQEYVLEVVMSGDYTIPPLEVSFTDRRDELAADEDREGADPGASGDEPAIAAPGTAGEDDGEPAEERVYKILTDPITIEVASLAEIDEELATLRPNAPQAEPPIVPESLRGPLIVGGACLGFAIVLGVVALILRLVLKKRVRLAPKIPPEELAYREFEWLIAQQFADRGALKEFYFHLSRIVREYIERRFGLRAPESTTEEFLEDLAHSDALVEEHKTLLRDFLEQADLVKFARYNPGPGELESSFEAAKRFIAETRSRVEPGEQGEQGKQGDQVEEAAAAGSG